MAESSEYTGERPGWGEGFDYDESRHLAAYHAARDLAAGKRVLDAGCGEGFGTQTLADVAAEVVGVDYSESAIESCKRTWNKPNLRFECVNLAEDHTLVDQFDLVLNFQVLEHIEDERPFLEGLKRRVAADGQLMLTTPNILMTFSENPYHVREYTTAELQTLLGTVFSSVDVQGMHGNERVLEFDAARAKAVQRILRLDPLGIRNRLPSGLVNLAFAKLSVLVRRSAKQGSGAADIRPDEFHVGRYSDQALDLVAFCRP